MTKMTLPMAEMPSVITESLRSVLAAHGYVLAKREQICRQPFAELRPLSEQETDDVLREAGNNTTMALFSIDEDTNAEQDLFGTEEPIAFSANDFYPPTWPRCPHCNDHALDGHITCGRVGCRERNESPAPPPGAASEEHGGAVELPPASVPSCSGCVGAL